MPKLSNKMIVTISFIIIIVGVLIFSSDYLKSKKDKVYKEVSVSLFVQGEDGKKDNTPQNVEDNTPEPEPEPEPEPAPSNEYLGVLTIDKIHLNQGFYDKGNKLNNVDKNITILDVAKITYKGKVYTYKIDNIYKEEKDGTVTIYRDEGRNTLTMITCTKDDNTKQTVYIAYLES